MKRTIEDIRDNLDHVGCDNETALEMCDEIERLRKGEGLFPVFDIIDRQLRIGRIVKHDNGRIWLSDSRGGVSSETFRKLCLNIIFMGL